MCKNDLVSISTEVFSSSSLIDDDAFSSKLKLLSLLRGSAPPTS